MDGRDRDALVAGGVLGIEGTRAVQADPRDPVPGAGAITSMRSWSVASSPQCEAALRWLRTAPGPQASTAANRWPSGRSIRCRRRRRPRDEPVQPARAHPVIHRARGDPQRAELPPATTPHCRAASSRQRRSGGVRVRPRLFPINAHTPRACQPTRDSGHRKRTQLSAAAHPSVPWPRTTTSDGGRGAAATRYRRPCALGSRHRRGRARSRRGAAGGEPQPAEGDRRQGDGPRLAGRRAARRAVPLRRRRPRLPLARRPRAPPDRLPRRGRRAARRRSQVAMRMARLAGPGAPALGAAAAAGVKHMAHRFIVGETPRDGRRRPARPVEATASRRRSTCSARRRSRTAEADRYAARCARRARRARRRLRARWPDRARARADSAGPLPRANLSVKVSALTPLLRPDAPERGQRDAAAAPARAAAPRARARRAPAHRHGVARLARGGPRARPRAARRGRVRATARRPGSCCRPTCATRPQLLDAILDWARATPRAPPLVVRLVKGAYWDHEIVEARQHGWSAPVFEVKADCDRNFEALTRRLLDARPARPRRDRARTTCARSPTRSPTTALTGGDDARPRAAGAARARRRPRRRRSPRGPARAHLLPGRRPRRRHGLPRAPAAREHVQRVLPRTSRPRAAARGAARRAMTDLPTFANEPILELRRAPRARRAGRRRWPSSTPELPLRVPVWIGDGERATARSCVSTDPGDARPRRRRRRRWRPAPRSTRRSRPPRARLQRWARDARPPSARRDPRRAPPPGCASAAPSSPRSRSASARSRGPRPTPTSARRSTSSSTTRAARSRSTRGAALLQVPGERNAMRYAPRGVVAVIAPWNFPLAIPIGMTAAGARDRQRRRPQAGRAVAGLRRCCVVRALREAGVPPDALALLPGEGDAGAALVARPARAHDRLHRLGPGRPARSSAPPPRSRPAQRHLKRVVAEMGGKNCVIVDSDADLDDAVPGDRRSPPSSTPARSARRPRACSSTRRSPTRCSSASPARSRCSSGRPGRRPSGPTSRR